MTLRLECSILCPFVYYFIQKSSSKKTPLLGRIHVRMHAPLGIGRGFFVQRALFNLVQFQLGPGSDLFQHDLAMLILRVCVVSF